MSIKTFSPSGPVAKAFMESEALFRGIMGPIGSAKSSTCCAEIMRRAGYYPPGPDGIRRPRFAVVRNTYPDLKSTTMETWFQWVPRSFGKVSWGAPITHLVKAPGLEMEVLFLALDRDEDVRKLLSLELTGIWFNEARYTPKSIVDAATGRVGRWVPYEAALTAWAGILADTNPPDTESWWYKLAEKQDQKMILKTEELESELRVMGVLKEGQPLFEFFRQPSGLSPDAENIQHLRKGYYQMAAANKTEDYIKVYIHGEYGFLIEGKPVYPQYLDVTHTAKEVFGPIPGLPVLVGADFGLTPSAIFGQRLADGQWRIFAELVTEHCGPTRFAEMLSAFFTTHYPDLKVVGAWGDPSGTAGEEEDTYFDILKSRTGWKWKPAPTNDPEIRREAVVNALNRMIEGKPGFCLSPSCSVLRKGFASGYHFKFVKTSNGTQMHEEPAKNAYSHPHDALQYLMLGGGEYEIVHQRDNTKRNRTQKVASGTGYDPFGSDERPSKGGRFQTAADMRDWRVRKALRQSNIAGGTDDDPW